MDDHDEDPLDMLEDDGDGVIETILLFDEEEEKDIQTRTGCSILILGVGASVVGTGWGIFQFLW